MERRKEPRLAVDSAVILTILGAPLQPPIQARVKDMSGSGLRLSSPLPIPCGAPVKVEGSDLLLLGEVCRSEPTGDRFIIGLKISHSLSALADLERLNRALVGLIKNKTVKTKVLV